MKVLFLDFDGVITYVRGSHEFENTVHPEALARLHEVVANTGCMIVVSSSWRHGHSLYQLAKILKLPTEIVIDKTPGEGEIFTHDDQGRGTCIAEWLALHGHEVDTWAIVDDDVFDMHPWMLGRIVQTTTGVGLTSTHVEELTALLSPY